jgi:hypothetical protein
MPFQFGCHRGMLPAEVVEDRRYADGLVDMINALATFVAVKACVMDADIPCRNHA